MLRIEIGRRALNVDECCKPDCGYWSEAPLSINRCDGDSHISGMIICFVLVEDKRVPAASRPGTKKKDSLQFFVTTSIDTRALGPVSSPPSSVIVVGTIHQTSRF